MIAWGVVACTQTISQPSSQVGRDQIYAALVGEWSGQLEYRDFQSDKRVVLPTWLEIKSAPPGSALQFSYTYDDGTSKIVRESSTLSVDPTNRHLTVTSDRDHSTDAYEVTSIETPKTGCFLLIATGSGTENKKQVDVRITIAIDRNLYQYKKETRLAGQEFNFRDGYVLTRRNPPE